MGVVILGAGPAGLTVAQTLRRYDRTTPITLVSAEPYPPYSPPALADHFVTGRDDTLFWQGRDVCDRLDVDYRMGAVVRTVRPAEHEVVFTAGQPLRYDKLVIATGSRLFAPIEGIELPGVFNFKSLRAASKLVLSLRAGGGEHAVIVGAGFIGVEVALLLAELGVPVSLIEAEGWVMPRMLDSETAAIVQASLLNRGVALRLDTEVVGLTGRRHVRRVELAGGESLRADVVVAATGVKPNLEPLAGAGIASRWGVWVDEYLRTNIADIYAAGDVAETPDRMTGERYVHAIFMNAVAQGRVVAHNLLGYDDVYDGAESANSLKHVGLPVMAVGAAHGEVELRWRRGHALRKVFVTAGRIVGFRLTGDVRGAGVYRSLMLRRVDVTHFGDRLVEPNFGTGQIFWEAATAGVAA